MQEVVLKLRLQGLTKPRCVSHRSFWPQDLYTEPTRCQSLGYESNNAVCGNSRQSEFLIRHKIPLNPETKQKPTTNSDDRKPTRQGTSKAAHWPSSMALTTTAQQSLIAARPRNSTTKQWRSQRGGLGGWNPPPLWKVCIFYCLVIEQKQGLSLHICYIPFDVA